MANKFVAPCGRSANNSGKALTVETLIDHQKDCPACVALRDNIPFDIQAFHARRDKEESEGRRYSALAGGLQETEG